MLVDLQKPVGKAGIDGAPCFRLVASGIHFASHAGDELCCSKLIPAITLKAVVSYTELKFQGSIVPNW